MDRKYLIIALVVVVIIFTGGGIALLSKHTPDASKAAPKQAAQDDQQVLTLKPEDIGLAITNKTYTKGSSSGPGLNLSITKLDGISSVSYEVQYTHTNDNGGDQQDAVIGNVDIKPGVSTVSQDFALGTCSDVCHFHKNIKDIKALVKVTKVDAKTYEIDTDVANP